MRTLPKTALSQPRAGIATSGCALAVLGMCWAAAADGRPDPVHALIAVALITATVLAYQFPIQIHYHHRVEVGSVPIYLMAVVLPVPLAATAAGLGILAAELS